VIGHTCSLGSEKFNADLSIDRANQVRQYLINTGIAPERFIIKGAGEKSPLNNGDTEADRAQNRRVEFRVRSL